MIFPTLGPWPPGPDLSSWDGPEMSDRTAFILYVLLFVLLVAEFYFMFA